jgi:hypothetical protein
VVQVLLDLLVKVLMVQMVLSVLLMAAAVVEQVVTLQYKMAARVFQVQSQVLHASMLAVAVVVQIAVLVMVALVLADVDLFVVKLQNLVLQTLDLVAEVTDVVELAVMAAQAL